MRKFLTTLAIAAGAALTMSACSAIDLTKKDTTPANNAANNPVPAASAASSPAPAGAGLRAVDSVLGKIVTDAKGWTLYRFDKDTVKPSKTNCVDACATNWPPVPYSAGLQLDGIDAGLVGKVQRPDGTWQVTINGWPVYRYKADTKVGDTRGQGVGGIWWAIAPDGKKAKPPVASSGGGY
jgi:predicted lipoprotein with Yx(FWY)xxD motif